MQSDELQKRNLLKFDILSLFPGYFDSPFGVSILKRAQERGLIEIGCLDIRNFAEGRHQQVDDRPYGGGPGMVLMAKPTVEAIRSVRGEKTHVVYMSPQGKPLTAERAKKFAEHEHLVLLCGHYEGIDERALQLEVDEEISIGEYVVTSGCPAAVIFVDAVARFVPGVVGHPDAPYQDSFEKGIFDTCHYTRPEVFEGLEVPPVLRQGNHREIEKWRLCQAEEKTHRVRPDLKLIKE